MSYIYQAISKDGRYSPPLERVVREFETEAETVNFLLNNGGGIYRNLLHNFECLLPHFRRNLEETKCS